MRNWNKKANNDEDEEDLIVGERYWVTSNAIKQGRFGCS